MAMKLEQTFGKTITNMVELQVTQQPEIAPFKQVMLDFFDKYMSWDSMKDEMGKIYTDEFSIDEIKELTKFYSSPVGEKAATRMPELMNKAANLGAQRVQKHMGELQQMIQAEAQKAQLQNGASPSPK